MSRSIIEALSVIAAYINLIVASIALWVQWSCKPPSIEIYHFYFIYVRIEYYSSAECEMDEVRNDNEGMGLPAQDIFHYPQLYEGDGKIPKA